MAGLLLFRHEKEAFYEVDGEKKPKAKAVGATATTKSIKCQNYNKYCKNRLKGGGCLLF